MPDEKAPSSGAFLPLSLMYFLSGEPMHYLSGVDNGRFRAECLNAHLFLSLADTQKKLEDWRKYYNEERPHGAIGNKPPITLLNNDGAASPPW